MLQTPLRPQYKVRFNVRPVRHAYLVRNDDLESTLRIIRFACAQWWGIRNLIIPVNSEVGVEPLFEELLIRYDPDIIVGYLSSELSGSHTDQYQLEAQLSRFFPHRIHNIRQGEIFETRDRGIHPIHVVPEGLRGSTLQVYEYGEASKDEQGILVALFGSIDSWDDETFHSLTNVERRPIRMNDVDFWSAQLNSSQFGSVLNFTGYGVVPYQEESKNEDNVFDVVLVNSVVSLCMYWNIRASKGAGVHEQGALRRTMLLPQTFLEDKPKLQELIDILKAVSVSKRDSFNVQVRFVAVDSRERGKLEDAFADLEGLEKIRTDETTKEGIINAELPLERPHILYQVAAPRFLKAPREGINPQMALNSELRLGINEVMYYPPEGFSNSRAGITAMDVECEVWQRYLPDVRVSGSIKSNSWFSRYGLSYLTAAPESANYEFFNLPDEWETLVQYFASRGYEIRTSPDGIYTDALVRLIGGIGQVNTLASRAAYLLLDTLALKSSKKLAQRIIRHLNLPDGAIADVQRLLTDVDTAPELKRIPKTYNQLKDIIKQPYRKDLLGLLSRLSQRQIIKRGFHLPCPNCGTPSWYPLQIIRETVTCIGCSHEFVLPLEQPPGSEIQWEYTLNTLVNRVMDQDALVATLALRYLTKAKESSCLTTGLELLQNNNVVAEFDLLYVVDQQLFAGECKASGVLGGKDIRTARLAADIGVRRFYFCTVSAWSGESRDSAQELVDELSSINKVMEIELLEGDALFWEDSNS